jgi:hypothetical protein
MFEFELVSDCYLTPSPLCKYETKLPDDKYDISQNAETIPVEQKQHYDKYDIAQNTGTIPVEQKQHYDKYDRA